ncbi:2S seed storage albumin protein-like [Solanum stenotomum]|uniref:2S seed storage albumin protein-like n=1 Tax=Solanum stenotomum TaxID=172797 RepID=UPI0020D1AB13|nr:2S seed storage albumin protein-like [Solanum stenotomum]
MGKVIIFGATCLAILFMGVTASSFRTTITIAENPWEQMSQRCQMEMQRAQNLRSCEEYLRQSTKFTEEGRYMDQQSGDWRQSFPRCCEQMEQMQDEQCRCEGIKQVMQQEQERGELQGREMREACKTAQSLPGLCRMSPHQCHNIPNPTFF